jgi:DNA-binding GntR family transcriptional regulator
VVHTPMTSSTGPTDRSSGRPPARAPEAYRLQPRRALTDDVYEAVKALVMDQVIAAGARMSIDGLARDLGVSPTPVREALTRLESEGLATKEALKGYRATPLLTREEFDDLFDFRRLIEPWAASRAAERIDDAGRARLVDELGSVSAPAGTSYDDYRRLTEHDQRFHSLVAELSGSVQVRRALERTHCHLHIFRLHYERATGHETLAEHTAVVEAITAADPAAAEAAMLHHLDAAMNVRLRTIYDTDEPGG